MGSSLLGDRLIVTIWVGSLLAIGYIAVPTAFATLSDVELAGTYAGTLFHIVNVIGVVCGSIMLITKTLQYKKNIVSNWRVWLIVIMMSISLIFLVYIEPQMAAIKTLEWKQNPELASQFSFLHTLSENLYLLMTLFGLALVVSSDTQPNKFKV